MNSQLRTLMLASIGVAALGLASSATPVQAETAKKPGHCVQSLGHRLIIPHPDSR
jgi:hypothetical protein